MNALLDSLDIRPSDQLFKGSGITVYARGNSINSIPAEVHCEIRGSKIGPSSEGSYEVDGAAIEMMSSLRALADVKLVSSQLLRCHGDGLIGESKGVSDHDTDSRCVLTIVGGMAKKNGLAESTTFPRLSQTGYMESNFASALMGADFSNSGIHLAANEYGIWPNVSFNQFRSLENGVHGVNLQSTGAYEFKIGFADVDVFSTILSTNGSYAHGQGTPGHGFYALMDKDSLNADFSRALMRDNLTSGARVDFSNHEEQNEKTSILVFANSVFTKNLGLNVVADRNRAPLVIQENSEYLDAVIQISHVTIVDNQSPYAVSVFNNTLSTQTQTDMWASGSLVENSILRDNGLADKDTSFYPEPNDPLWAAIFAETYFSNLEATGIANPGFYTTDRQNLYDDPQLRPLVFQGIDFGTTIPATPSTNPSGLSPIGDRGRLPIVSIVGTLDVRGSPRNTDHASFPNFENLWTHDLGAIEVESDE